VRSRIVVHFLDGTLIKGWSPDLFPNKPTFHVADWESDEMREVRLADLKGVFFVKEFPSAPTQRSRRYDVARPGLGRRVRVRFRDGEVVEGYTNGYSPERLAFFVFPPDPEDNTDRMLVVTRATAEVKLV
jgi:hypothetical protein